MDANTMRDQMIARLRSTNYDVSNIDDREASDILSRAHTEFVVRRIVGDLNVKRKGFEIDKKRRVDTVGLLTGHAAFTRTKTSGAGDFIIGSEDNGALRTPDKDYQLQSGAVIPTSVTADFGIFVRIPDECMFIIGENVDTSKGSQSKVNVPIEVIAYEEYQPGLRDPYKSPYYNKCWRLDSGNYTPASSSNSETSTKNISGTNADGTTGTSTINTERAVHLIPGKDWRVEKYHLRYIKKPRPIIVDIITPVNQISSELVSTVHDEIVDIAVKLYTADRLPEQVKFQASDKEVREDE